MARTSCTLEEDRQTCRQSSDASTSGPSAGGRTYGSMADALGAFSVPRRTTGSQVRESASSQFCIFAPPSLQFIDAFNLLSIQKFDDRQFRLYGPDSMQQACVIALFS